MQKAFSALNGFQSLSIKTKIIGSFFLATAVAAVPGIISLNKMNVIANSSAVVVNEKIPLQTTLEELKQNFTGTLVQTQEIVAHQEVPTRKLQKLQKTLLMTEMQLYKLKYGSKSPEFAEFLQKNSLKLSDSGISLPLFENPEAQAVISKLLQKDFPKLNQDIDKMLNAHYTEGKYVFDIDGKEYSIADFAAKEFIDFRAWVFKLEKAVQYGVPFKGETDYTKSSFHRWYQNARIEDSRIAKTLERINGYNKRIYESAKLINNTIGKQAKQSIYKVQSDTDFRRFEQQLNILSLQSNDLFSALENDERNAFIETYKTSNAVTKNVDMLSGIIMNDIHKAKEGSQRIAKESQQIVISCLIGMAVLSLLAGFAMSNAITKPVLRMIDAMKKISTGDVSVSVETNSKDEIGQMAQALMIFRNNKIATDKLQQESLAEQEKQAEFERKNIEKQRAVLEKVRFVVSECAKGNFSHRLEIHGLDNFLSELASGINQIGDVSDRGLSEIRDALEALAAGRLSKRITGQYKGMFHEIQQAFNRTGDKLETTVKEIVGSSHDLFNASNEICLSCDNLSRRTETQVVTLEETSASMEELTETVKQNTVHALEASDFANNAKNTASQGTFIIDQVVNSMQTINESSSKIANIINVINEIAFQTNLLALNASIEAARAGTAGRGFSVVASEVRALAGRASSAADEIQELVTISVNQVRDGSSLVNQAGSTLKEIVTSFNQVTHLVSEIAVASEQQTIGIERMNRSILSIDENTMHNSAMVQQTAAAARGINDLGNNLKALTDFFQVNLDNTKAKEMLRKVS